ncbi:hypothetical protein LNK15_14925, partial [Jeotgalicoccus huakuii]|nr:hypothetical protein [Jeotgalicoccus huakuii]
QLKPFFINLRRRRRRRSKWIRRNRGQRSVIINRFLEEEETPNAFDCSLKPQMKDEFTMCGL